MNQKRQQTLITLGWWDCQLTTWTPRYVAKQNKQHYENVSNEIDAPPIAECCGKSEQQKAHGHVLEWAYLKKPPEPVERSRCATITATATKCSQHQVFGDEARRNCQKAEVIASVNAVPKRAHRHCYRHPEWIHTHKHSWWQTSTNVWHQCLDFCWGGGVRAPVYNSSYV